MPQKQSGTHAKQIILTKVYFTMNDASATISEEPLSLEFIEDSYLPKLDNIQTPSLDEYNDYYDDVDDIDDDSYFERSSLLGDDIETEQYLRKLTLDEIFYVDVDYDYANTLELQAVEAEFINDQLNKQTSTNSLAKRFRLKFFTKRSLREVKVTFIDFSKPYLAKISNSENYKKFLNINSNEKSKTETMVNKKDNSKMSEPTSPAASVASADIAAEFAALTVEEQDKQRAEWSQELARVEEEINTLRTVLASKTRHASDLKRKLGITVWREISDDMNQGLKNVKESSVFQSVEQSVGSFTKAVHEAPIFQRTESVIKSTAEKTSSVFGSITSGISSKFSQMKNSDSMKSIEEKVGSAYENVKGKVSTSRSGSVSSFPDALNEHDETSALNSPTDSVGK